ncbi:MAG: 2-phospho-L-lactate transferase [Candidatus Korobacteraceae bacterium]
MKVVIFTGGTGGTKLVQGVQRLVAPEALTVVVNTGDDIEWWGLHVSPDIDSVLYGLSGLLSIDRGWGVDDDSFRCLERMKHLGEPAWFSLGDLDLATHLTRTSLLREGRTLTEATAELAKRMGINARVLPMSDERVATMLETSKGRLHFQEYFVRERHSVEVSRVEFVGVERSQPAPGLLEAIASADAIVFAPSNPVTSIGPILAVPGIRETLRNAGAPVAAVSPIIGDAAVSGPAAALMRMQGWPSTIAGIAQAYADFLDVLVIDSADAHAADELSSEDLRVVCSNTLMRSMDDKVNLARVVLDSSLLCQHQSQDPSLAKEARSG